MKPYIVILLQPVEDILAAMEQEKNKTQKTK